MHIYSLKHTFYRTKRGTKSICGSHWQAACSVKLLLQVFIWMSRKEVCMWQLGKVKVFQVTQEWTCREGSQDATWS